MTPTYFTDRDLGKRFPGILREAGLSVERHADHFRPDAPDEEWLHVVGQRGWVAVTHDARIRYRPNERNAVIESGIVLLIVIGKAPYAELAAAFVATEPKIRKFLASHQAPYIAKVYRPSVAEVTANPGATGRVELWYPQLHEG